MRTDSSDESFASSNKKSNQRASTEISKKLAINSNFSIKQIGGKRARQRQVAQPQRKLFISVSQAVYLRHQKEVSKRGKPKTGGRKRGRPRKGDTNESEMLKRGQMSANATPPTPPQQQWPIDSLTSSGNQFQFILPSHLLQQQQECIIVIPIQQLPLTAKEGETVQQNQFNIGQTQLQTPVNRHLIIWCSFFCSLKKGAHHTLLANLCEKMGARAPKGPNGR